MKNFIVKSAMLMMFLAFAGCSGSDDSKPEVECPDGYTGVNCLEKITPKKVKINKVEIQSFPALNYDTNNYWDANETGINRNPDIYFMIYQNGGYIYELDTYMANADYQVTNTFNLPNPIIITDIDSPIILELRDYNAHNNTYQIMDNSYPVFVYEPSGVTFPSTITLFNSHDYFVVTLHVTYEW